MAAYERGWVDVVESYVHEHPTVAAAVGTLAQLDADERDDFVNAAHYAPVRRGV